MEQRSERIVLITDRGRIVGDLSLPASGHRSRLSDFLNTGTPAFVSLTDVELTVGDGPPSRREFVVVALAHVRIAHPLAGGTPA